MRARPLGFTADGLEMEAELVMPSDGAASLVLLCHGIPGGGPPDPSDPGYPGLARDVATAGHAAVWFNFRGCRTAPGDFSIAGWERDLEALLDRLDEETDLAGLPRVVLGSSAGGATAIVVAARRPDVAALATLAAVATWRDDDLLDEPAALVQRFRNIGIIRDPAFPRDLGDWTAEFDRSDPEAVVERVAPRPLLFVHGDADDVVAYHHAERLFARAGEPKELVRLPRGGHQLRRDPRAIDAVLDWLGHAL